MNGQSELMPERAEQIRSLMKVSPNSSQLLRPRAVFTNPVRALVHSPGFGMALLTLAHPFLALAMRETSLFATAHAFITLTIGLLLAAFSKDSRKVAYVAAYIAGAEVLWRMNEAQIFWEAGKYYTIFVLGVALFRIKLWQRSLLPILYFGLLSLSLVLTLSRLGISSAARDVISFNMSGPFALMLCTLYFSQVTFDSKAIRWLAWWLILPILGIATLTFSGMLSAAHISFTDESNFAASAGFGPNQVSAALGLGGSLTLILFLKVQNFVQRLISLMLAVLLLSLSALTFSRGGLYNAAVMLVLMFAHYLRSPRVRIAALAALLVFGLVGGYVVFPRLNAFTGGKLEERFANLDLTLRGQIARADLTLWSANPWLGVGPGLSATDRIDILGVGDAAHTEYTRLLAEHGTAGLLAILVLLLMPIRAYLRAPGLESQAWVSALLGWSLMEMSHAAMRMVAISFLFGLALVNWESETPAAEHGETSQ